MLYSVARTMVSPANDPTASPVIRKKRTGIDVTTMIMRIKCCAVTIRKSAPAASAKTAESTMPPGRAA